MSFTTTSKYVQLAPYLVMEYLYADQPNPETYPVNTGVTTVGYNKLINGVLTDTNGEVTNDAQIFNLDEDSSITQNTRLNSVVKVTDSSFITLNPNLIIPYNDFNSGLTSTANLEITFPSNISVIYDSVRYHILAGYNLDNIDGLIVTIQYPDTDGSYVTVSQIKISKGSVQEYTLNPSPLTIGANIYDKYFEVKIPSLADMNNKYQAASASNKPKTLSALTSKSGNGYLMGPPIRIKAYEILNTTPTSGYDTYGTQLSALLSLETTDPYSDLGAHIGPADTGDFFEYFATDNGGFPEDFILFQNSIGNSYYIQHAIEVLEQIGAALIETSNFTSIQTSAYDVPLLFRPIVQYASVATSFTLRYTMTLINSKDQSRLIRIATYTSSDPSSYGLTITPLTLSILPQQQKIYNKVANRVDISIPEEVPLVEQIVKYSNVFIDKVSVNTTVSNLNIGGTDIKEIGIRSERANTREIGTSLSEINTDPTRRISTNSDDGNLRRLPISYGMGKAHITISPFDNYYKFTLYQKSGDGSTKELDLSASGNYTMVFIDNKTNKVSAPSITDKNLANPGKGELAFKVDESLSTQVLQFTNRNFYISNRPSDSTLPESPLGISKVSSVKERLAKKSVALDDSIKDITMAAKESSVFGTSKKISRNSARITSKSTSTIYWGKWLKEGEGKDEPSVTSILDETKVILDSKTTTEVASKKGVGKSSWQVSGSKGGKKSGTSGTADPVKPSPIPAKLAMKELVSSIASDVQGKIALGWTTNEIIKYFLDPSSPGFKLYEGIDKAIFKVAVSGIFSARDMILLDNYGNTEGGQSNGGSASQGGSSSNQSGSDSGGSGRPGGNPRFPHQV